MVATCRCATTSHWLSNIPTISPSLRRSLWRRRTNVGSLVRWFDGSVEWVVGWLCWRLVWLEMLLAFFVPISCQFDRELCGSVENEIPPTHTHTHILSHIHTYIYNIIAFSSSSVGLATILNINFQLRCSKLNKVNNFPSFYLHSYIASHSCSFSRYFSLSLQVSGLQLPDYVPINGVFGDGRS